MNRAREHRAKTSSAVRQRAAPSVSTTVKRPAMRIGVLVEAVTGHKVLHPTARVTAWLGNDSGGYR